MAHYIQKDDFNESDDHMTNQVELRRLAMFGGGPEGRRLVQDAIK